MRICVISSTVFAIGQHGTALSGYGGLEVVAWETARGLAKRGHEVTLIAPQGSWCPGVNTLQCLPPGAPEEGAYGGFILKDANGADVRWPGYWSKLLEFNDGGVIISHDWQKWCYMLKAEGRLTAPILGVMHAPVNSMIQQMPPVDKPCFVCISNDQRQHFEALFSPRQARTNHNGIDVDLYKSLDVPRTNRYLFLARFSSVKSPDIALRQCKKAGVSLDLVGDVTITGEPGYYEECKRLAQSMDAKIVPGVSRGETVWWYSRAHCFVHPTLHFREPLGLAPLEAQSCGLPVIGFKYGALKETVKEGETGWLVDTEEEYGDLIRETSKGIPDTMRTRCREWVGDNFTLDRMISGYEKLCQEALDSPW